MAKTAADQSVRVLTTFFAALIGFGLKHLLDSPIPGVGWLAFLLAIVVFLRFLTGSANHLWREHVKAGVEACDHWLYALDLGFLVIFGVIALAICYARTAEGFFLMSAVLLLTALGWGGLDHLILSGKANHARDGAKIRYADSKTRWSFWFPLDCIHFVAFLLALVAVAGPSVGIGPAQVRGQTFPVQLAWILMLAVSVVILGFDAKGQMKAMEDT
jgi:hypothetical protein